jgi:hypothetical protein
MSTNNNFLSDGIGLCGFLSLAFIILKLTGCIDWSWWWVLAPSWVIPAIMVAVIIARVIQFIIKEIKS